MIRTVGIDLSLTATGIARSDGACARVGRTGITRLSVTEQIQALDALTEEIIATALERGADAVAIEGPDMAQGYGGLIERTVLWWQVVRVLHGFCTVYVVPSAQLKIYATGSGRPASKNVIKEAVARLWPQFRFNNDDNMADASVLAAIAAHLQGEPIDPVSGALDATHTRALVRIRSVRMPPPIKKQRTHPRERSTK